MATQAGLFQSPEESQYDLLRRLQDQGILPREIAQLDIDIDSARSNYRKLTGQEPPVSPMPPENAKKLTVKYEIVRQPGEGASAPRSSQLDQYDQLKPGDTLLVSLE